MAPGPAVSGVRPLAGMMYFSSRKQVQPCNCKRRIVYYKVRFTVKNCRWLDHGHGRTKDFKARQRRKIMI